MRQRHRQDSKDCRKPGAAGEAAAPSVDLVKVSERRERLAGGKVPSSSSSLSSSSALFFAPPTPTPQDADCPRTHGYTNPQLDVEDPPSVAVWGEAE